MRSKLILASFLFACSALAQPPMPIQNGKLMSTLDANNQTISNTGNITGNGSIAVTGNITGAFILGNGSLLTGISGGGPSGNLVYTDVANQTITGNLTAAAFNGTFSGNGTNLTLTWPGTNTLLQKGNGDGIAMSWDRGAGAQSRSRDWEFGAGGAANQSSYVFASSDDGGLNATEYLYFGNNQFDGAGSRAGYSVIVDSLGQYGLWVGNATNGNFRVGGTSYLSNIASPTGNLSLSGTNLTISPGDINMSGGDITNVNNITFSGTNVSIRNYGSNLTLGSTDLVNGNIDLNAGTASGARIAMRIGSSIPWQFYSNRTISIGAYVKEGIVVSSNTTVTSFANEIYVIDTANVTLTFNDIFPIGSIIKVKNLSAGNVSTVLSTGGASTIIVDGNSTVASQTIVIPPYMTLSASYVKFTSGPIVVYWRTELTGTPFTTTLPSVTISKATNHTVNSVAGGGNITNTMSFARVTSTGNVTVFDGASGDWITVKNNSGGVVTLLSADTFDGNATFTLNSNDAVSLTSTGADWMTH